MKTLIATTALTLTLAGAAFAGSHSATEGEDLMEAEVSMESADATDAAEMDIVTDADTAVESETDGTMLADGGMDAADAMTREGFVQADAQTMTADELLGTSVYNLDDEDLGEVEDLVIADDGQIAEVVLEVGGILGLGDKNVAVPFEDLSFMVADGGEELRVYTRSTLEELEAMPTYED